MTCGVGGGNTSPGPEGSGGLSLKFMSSILTMQMYSMSSTLKTIHCKKMRIHTEISRTI